MVLKRAAEKARRDGILELAAAAPSWFFDRTARRRYIRYRSEDTFSVGKEQYPYCYATYNVSWKNPRSVEIPVAKAEIRRAEPTRMLEVGNVLSHYGVKGHDVVDKYERASDVINEDVVSFEPGQQYDLIVSVSTLEHVGFDSGESGTAPEKVLEAVERMKSWLADEGRLFVTVPYDYNPHLDEYLRNEAFGFTERRYPHRYSKWNEWQECSWDELTETTWGAPYEYANGLTLAWFDQGENR